MELDVSIVIVNYNVQYFLEQCLNSIFRNTQFSGKYEVIIIDNASDDGSVDMINDKFTEVRLIKNDINSGFSVANNQGFKIARGKYILMLNPDTILEELTLQKCFDKMEEDLEIGALGVKMVDGGGRFLPESKRGFPSPIRSFYRFTGIYKLFPRSNALNGYYFGAVGEDENAEVEILCGAFMFMRRKDLDQIGGLDESFFMYGEDIDLSYRFIKNGKKVYYFPESTIIHFKGESTKKNSAQYVKRFYEAMDIFAKKHFSSSKAKSFLWSLSVVIRIKSLLNIFNNVLKTVLIPFLDITLILAILWMVTKLWATFYFNDPSYYNSASLPINYSIYTSVWILFLFYSGGYDEEMKAWKVIRNILLGSLIILAIYGLLPVQLRSSRAVIIISTIIIIPGILLLRAVSNFIAKGFFGLDQQKNKKILLIASKFREQQIKSILEKADKKFHSIITLPPSISNFEIGELLKINKINEIICHSEDIGMKRIISMMATFGDKVAFKITGDESLGIIGSPSKNKSGEIYTVSVKYAIQEAYNKRLKRTLDFLSGLIWIITSPILFLTGKSKNPILSGIKLISGKMTMVGYCNGDEELSTLPKLPPSITSISRDKLCDSYPHAQNMEYAKNYSIWKDVRRLAEYLIKN